MRDSRPLVTVGIPCYNEERFIVQTLQSACALQYDNLEILVSDNASTDKTPGLIEDLMARDNRIRLVKQPSNVGAKQNFVEALDAARGTYFFWLGAHDLIDSNYVAAAVEILERRPDVSLVHPQLQFIDLDSINLFTKEYFEMNSESNDELTRMMKVYTNSLVQHQIHGVFRREIRNQLIFADTVGPDHLLLFIMARLGKLVRLDSSFVYLRVVRQETWDEMLQRYQKIGMDISSGYVDLTFLHYKYVFTSFYKSKGFFYCLRFFLAMKRKYSALAVNARFSNRILLTFRTGNAAFLLLTRATVAIDVLLTMPIRIRKLLTSSRPVRPFFI